MWRSSRGYDAGKKISGRKRHIAVDTLGLLICVLVTAASVQDRDGARPLLQQLTPQIARSLGLRTAQAAQQRHERVLARLDEETGS